MDRGSIYIYTGDGRGKSPAAWGRALQAAAEGKKVVIIQFLKGRELADSAFIRRMEPEIRLFHFEKSDENYMELPEEKKREACVNIRNGLGYAKKVLSVAECDLLILDEVLVLVDAAERPEEIDEARARREADEAREALLQRRSRQEHQLAQATLARAMNRLRVKARG